MHIKCKGGWISANESETIVSHRRSKVTQVPRTVHKQHTYLNPFQRPSMQIRCVCVSDKIVQQSGQRWPSKVPRSLRLCCCSYFLQLESPYNATTGACCQQIIVMRLVYSMKKIKKQTLRIASHGARQTLIYNTLLYTFTHLMFFYTLIMSLSTHLWRPPV